MHLSFRKNILNLLFLLHFSVYAAESSALRASEIMMKIILHLIEATCVLSQTDDLVAFS